MKIAIILPAFNEQDKIGDLVQKIRMANVGNILFEIVVVDDGSTDRTFDVAKAAGANHVIHHPNNRGVGAAIRTGITYARKEDLDAIVIMGGDNQDDPNEIPRFIEKLEQGYDFVQGSRYLSRNSGSHPPLFRLLTTKAFTYAMRLTTGFPYTDASNGFRAFRPAIIDKIDLSDPKLDRYQLETFLTIEAAKKFRVAEVPVTKTYPKNYSKMKRVVDWWRISAPIWSEMAKRILHTTTGD